MQIQINHVCSILTGQYLKHGAHGDNMISIRMLTLSDESICKPLNIIFISCLNQVVFQSEWKNPR